MPQLHPRFSNLLQRSDPNAQASPLRILFLAVALLGVLGTALSLTRSRGGPLDATEFLRSLYGDPVPQPAGFQEPTAITLPTGEKVVTFEAADGAELPALSAGGSTSGATGFPTQLVLMEFPVSRAASVLKSQFQELRFDSGKSKFGGGGGGRGGRGGGGPGGGSHGGSSNGSGDKDKKPKLQDAGTFLWQGYDATYARLRYGKGKPEDDEPFYDVMRVNLSVGGHCVIAYLRFPDRQLGELATLRAILAGFRPVTQS